jgi:1-acyl-sn-glycerol-3-phosphate acyltransferase
VVDACRERLAAGASVGLYPEGTRNRRPGRLLRGRSGLGWLVLGSTAPVVPVGIRFPAAERLGRTPLLGRIAVRIDDPLTFAPERAAHAAQIAHAAPAASAAGAAVLGAPGRRLARRVVAAVMAELAALSDRTPGVRPPRPSASPNPPPTPDWGAVQGAEGPSSPRRSRPPRRASAPCR